MSRCSEIIKSGHEAPLSSELARELEDSRKLSLNSLMTFLGIHLIAGSEVLGQLTLALLLYTISLHLAISATFLQKCPTLSRLLHIVPFLGISGMVAVELVIGVQSPAAAAGGLLVGVLPSLTIAIYHAKRYTELGLMYLPVRMRKVAPPISGSTGATSIMMTSSEN